MEKMNDMTIKDVLYVLKGRITLAEVMETPSVAIALPLARKMEEALAAEWNRQVDNRRRISKWRDEGAFAVEHSANFAASQYHIGQTSAYNRVLDFFPQGEPIRRQDG